MEHNLTASLSVGVKSFKLQNNEKREMIPYKLGFYAWSVGTSFQGQVDQNYNDLHMSRRTAVYC